MAAANKTTLPPRTLREIVLNEEGVFREVTDRAWILHDRLSEVRPIEGQEQVSLSRLAGDLLSLGHQLNDLFEELFEVGKSQPEC